MMKCQLCGYEYDPQNLVCHAGCPLARHCAVICCPNCGYQVVDDGRSRSAAAARQVQIWFGEWRTGRQNTRQEETAV